MHNSKADEMLDYIVKAGVDIRPEAMELLGMMSEHL